MNRFIIGSRTFPIFLIAVLHTCLSISSTFAADAAEELKLFSGTWQPKEASLGGNIIDKAVLDKAKVVFDKDKYTLTIDEKVEQGSFTVDPMKSPKTMDIYPTSGDNNGKTFWTIYELDGDKLTVSYSLTAGVRPEDFKPLSNTLLVVKYERLKE